MTTLATTRLCSKVKVKDHSSHNVSHKALMAKITAFHLESTDHSEPLYRSSDINLCDIMISRLQSFDTRIINEISTLHANP